MSPTSPRELAAGSRQAPFNLHKDSHLIHKAMASPSLSSSPTNSPSVSSPSAGNNRAHPPAPRQHHHRHPVIIYTHSPKVIRTNARDFMSIVQKLTGLDSSTSTAASAAAGASSPRAAPPRNASASPAVMTKDESSSSSESCADVHTSAPYMEPQIIPPAPVDAHLVPDVPLFAPEPSELLRTSGGIYRYPDAVAFGPVTTNMNNGGAASRGAFSPSVAETMRAFPDY